MAVLPTGASYITGVFEGTVKLGGSAMSTAGYEDVFLLKLQADGSFSWSKGWGSDSPDNCNALAVDSNNNVWMSGTFKNSISFGGPTLTSTGSALFLAKFDQDGNHQFSTSFSTQAGGLLVTDKDDNIVLAGAGGDLDLGGGSLTGEAFVGSSAHLGVTQRDCA